MLTYEIAMSTAKHLASVKGRKQVIAEFVGADANTTMAKTGAVFVVVPKSHELRGDFVARAIVDNLGNVEVIS